MVLWWLANLVGLLVVVPLVVYLASRVISHALECRRYADDILVHGVGLSGNLDPVPALAQTREAVGEITTNAVRYVTALNRATSA
ncbi:MAG: hypothetical protein M3387_06065 [Actinomycetota bacterium]|nr:hypothetical protein [Actinomycetota bacterium]